MFLVCWYVSFEGDRFHEGGSKKWEEMGHFTMGRGSISWVPATPWSGMGQGAFE